MIGSIAATGAGLSSYLLTGSTSSISSASTQAAGQRTTPEKAGLGDLTAADWKLVSAAVGKNVGPDASGNIPAQPLLAASIEMERQSGGSLASGRELTVGDLKAMGANQPIAGFVHQIQNAISYLMDNSQTSLGSSSGSAVNITA
jgi:hypothetical protein